MEEAPSSVTWIIRCANDKLRALRGKLLVPNGHKLIVDHRVHIIEREEWPKKVRIDDLISALAGVAFAAGDGVVGLASYPG